jgi:ribosomal protein S18 acetylase RimI-like enzyme
MQGRGLGRRMVAATEARARALGLPVVELQVRVELVENHAAFQAMGFEQVGETAHPGFARATSFTFRKRL